MLSWGMFQKAFIHHTSLQPHSWHFDVLPLLRDAAILRGGFGGAHCQTPLILLRGELEGKNPGAPPFLDRGVRGGRRAGRGEQGGVVLPTDEKPFVSLVRQRGRGNITW